MMFRSYQVEASESRNKEGKDEKSRKSIKSVRIILLLRWREGGHIDTLLRWLIAFAYTEKARKKHKIPFRGRKKGNIKERTHARGKKSLHRKVLCQITCGKSHCEIANSPNLNMNSVFPRFDIIVRYKV
jgi:hypothetical protein